MKKVKFVLKFFASAGKLNTFRLLNKNTLSPNPSGTYMFKVNHRNTRARCEICSKLTINTPE